MSKSRKIYIALILLMILALYICFMALDFSRFFGLSGYFQYFYPSAVLKRITVVLAAVIAWTVGKNGLNMSDSRIMKLVFAVICSAETAFLLRRFIAGVALFGICQSLLIIRNGRGLKKRLSYAAHNEKIRLGAAGAAIVIAHKAMIIVSHRVFVLNPQLIAAWIYGAALSVSLWTGLANNILGLFPKVNSRMVAAGMFCFYCCDILVGLDAVLEVGPAWLAANSFIWVFYTPAVTLLALSCYKY